jgi:Ca2+-binding EF-hand superfamily protein
MQSKFDSLDVNHDGYIDKQEAASDSKLLKQFDRLDANKDMKLSLTEFSSAKGLAMTTKEKAEKDRQ